MWWFTPIITATWEVEAGGSQFKARQYKVSTRPYLKKKLKNKAKRTGAGAQMVDCLPSKA
jgi:hypothetical protein